MPAPVQYTRNGEINIAYQVVGDAPRDILMIPGWVSHLELEWDEPRWVRWCERMTRFARLTRFDKRGTGLSDRPAGIPTADERVEDARAGMDAVGLERAHVMGWSEGGPLAVMLAVTHPERVQSLILFGTQATFSRRPDYPFGNPDVESDYLELERAWGTEEQARHFVPDGDPATISRLALLQRAGASPSAPGPPGRYLAERIPGARRREGRAAVRHRGIDRDGPRAGRRPLGGPARRICPRRASGCRLLGPPRGLHRRRPHGYVRRAGERHPRCEAPTGVRGGGLRA